MINQSLFGGGGGGGGGSAEPPGHTRTRQVPYLSAYLSRWVNGLLKSSIRSRESLLRFPSCSYVCTADKNGTVAGRLPVDINRTKLMPTDEKSIVAV